MSNNQFSKEEELSPHHFHLTTSGYPMDICHYCLKARVFPFSYICDDCLYDDKYSDCLVQFVTRFCHTCGCAEYQFNCSELCRFRDDVPEDYVVTCPDCGYNAAAVGCTRFLCNYENYCRIRFQSGSLIARTPQEEVFKMSSIQISEKEELSPYAVKLLGGHIDVEINGVVCGVDLSAPVTSSLVSPPPLEVSSEFSNKDFILNFVDNYVEPSGVEPESFKVVDEMKDEEVIQYMGLDDTKIEADVSDLGFKLEGESPSKPILRKSAAVFVPPYRPGMSLTQINDMIPSDFDLQDLIKLGYPLFLLQRIKTTRERNSILVKFPKRPQSVISDRISKSAGVSGVFSNRFSVGEVAEVWRIPILPAPQILKPLRYNNQTFKAWVNGQAYALSKTFSKLDQVVTGNSSCRALYFSRNAMSSAVEATLLSQAQVYVYSYKSNLNQKFSQTYYSDSIELPPAPRVLRFLEHTVYTVEEMMKFEWIFNKKKDKPIFRACIQYLEGALIDEIHLRTSLLEKYPIIELQCKRLGLNVGINTTSTVDVRHSIPSIPTIDICHSVDLSSIFGPNFDTKGFTKYCISTALFISSLSSASSWQNVISIIGLFAATNAIVAEVCKDIILTISSQFVTVFQGTGFFFDLIKEDLSYLWESVVSCGIVSMLSELGSSTVGLVVPLIRELVTEFRRAITKESAATIATGLLAWIKDVFSRIQQCVACGSIDPLISRKRNPIAWCKEADAICLYETKLIATSSCSTAAFTDLEKIRKAGEISASWTAPVSVEEFLQRVEVHLKEGEDLYAYFKSYPSVSIGVGRSLNGLRNLFSRIRLEATSTNDRATPFGIFMHSVPGTGKTTIVHELISAIGRRCGYELGSRSIYEFVPNSNFQDGLFGTHWAIILDDVDQTAAPLAAGVQTYVDHVVAMINNKPYAIEKADLASKGKIFGYPKVVLQISNFEDGLASQKSHEPQAYWRRFSYYIEIEVKPEFADGTRLDRAKADKASTYDMYNVHVWEYSPAKGLALEKKNERIMSYPDFVVLMVNEYIKHMEMETRRLQKVACTDFCSVCGLSANRDCTHVQSLGVVVEDKSIETGPLPAGDGYYMNLLKIGALEEYQPVTRIVKQDRRYADSEHHLELIQVAYFADSMLDTYEDGLNARMRKQSIFSVEPTEICSHWRNMTHEERAFWSDQCLDYYAQNNVYKRRIRNWFRDKFTVCDTIYQGWDKYKSAILEELVRFTFITAGFITISRLAIRYMEKQSRVANASDDMATKNWARAEQDFVPSINPSFGHSSFTKQDILDVMSASHAEVINNNRVVHAFALGGPMFLTVTHIAKKGDTVTIKQRSAERQLQLTDFNFRVLPSNPQLSLIKFEANCSTPGILNKMWEAPDLMIHRFDLMEIYSPNLRYAPIVNNVVMMDHTRVLQTNAETIDGDCGSLYVAKHGEAWKIVGMHYARCFTQTAFGEKSNSLAGIVSAGEMKKVAQSMVTIIEPVLVVNQVLTKAPKELHIGKFGPYSEVWTAKSNSGAIINAFGQMTPPLTGSTMKSGVKLSLLYDDLRGLEKEFCGREGYWRIPNFKGRMVDDVWDSPYTAAFKSQNEVVFDEELAMLAVYDYLNGITGLLCDGYARLTEEQMLTGITGSYVNAINIKTSMGPPFNKAKYHYVKLDREEGSIMAPEVWELYDCLDSVLASGGIPGVLSIWSQKDEAVKPAAAPNPHDRGKHPRIFNSLPGSFNFLMKRHGVWKSFMRSNPEFFESAVGINMTSKECSRVPKFLQAVSPNLDEIYDGDATAMDKSWNGSAFEVVAKVVYAMSTAIGVDADINRRLVLANKYMMHYVKGDLFQVFHNPSGNDATVEFNGILISIGERMVYYKNNPYRGDLLKVKQWWSGFYESPIHPLDLLADFRSNVALMTYGDDNIKAMRIPPPTNYCQQWKELVGIEMKDANKSGVMTKSSRIQFLKRDIIWDEDLQSYKPPIDKKTIARMLLMKKESILGLHDHAATVITEALKEMFYHGREEFSKLTIILKALVDKYQLGDNPYLVMKDYDYWRDEFLKGDFQPWSTRPVVNPVSISNYTISYQMSSIKLVNATSSGANVVTDEQITHGAGVLDISSVSAEEIQTVQNFQTFPQTDLNDCLQRAFQGVAVTISETDVSLGLVTSFQPWVLLQANVFNDRKLKDYSLIRGTIQVTGVFITPPLALGGYTVAALPHLTYTGGGGVVSADLLVENSLQTDHSAYLDVAKSTSFCMQLPWMADRDALPLGSAELAAMWKVYIHCLKPIGTSIPNGVTTGYIKIYINLIQDYELTVPVFQARKLIANKALKTLAPSIHASIGEGKGSALVGKVAEFAEAASKLPVIGAFAGPAAVVARGAQSILDYFGFTRDSNESVPIAVVNRSVTNVARLDGPDPSEIAALSMNNAVTIDPAARGFQSEDCMATADLYPRWTLVDSFDWTTLMASDTIIGSVPVTPSFGRAFSGTGFEGIHFTTAGYVGLPFSFWRGTMEYRIIIPVSKTHRGTVQLIWVPIGANPAVDVTNRSLNRIVDITSESEVVLSIGYARDEPYLENRLMTKSMAILPEGAANGFLSIKVINPLLAQSSTSNTKIFVYARANPDMDFALPRDLVSFGASTIASYVIRTQVALQSKMVLQSGAIGDDILVTNESPEPLVPTPNTYPGAELLWGESINSVRGLMQKPSQINRSSTIGTNITVTSHFPNYFLLPGQASAVYTSVLPVWTWIGYYRGLFYGVSGSERYKLLPRDQAWAGMSRTLCLTNDLVSYVSTLAPMTFTGSHRGAEFLLPYYQPKKFISSYCNDDRLDRVHIRLMMSSLNTNTQLTAIYVSAGPDITATSFRQVPSVIFNTTPLAATAWY